MDQSDELDQMAADYLHGGRTEKARALCEQVLRIAPQRTRTMELLALALAGGGMHAQGAQQLARAVALEPDNASLQANLGIMLTELRDLPGAIHALGQAARLAPQAALIHYNLANALGAAAQLAAAAASYRRALELDPTLAVAYNNLGVIERRIGNVPAAISSFESAVALDRGFAAAHGNLGCAKVAAGLPWEGIVSLKQAALLQPTSIVALRDVTQALVSVDEFQLAFTLYEHALKLHPDSADLHHEYGSSLLRCGLAAEALPQLERALARDASLAEAHLNRASALLQLGRVVEANAGIRRAVAMDASLPYALSTQLTIQRTCADWSDLAALEKRVAALASTHPASVHPYATVLLSDDPQLQRHVARNHLPTAALPRPGPPPAGRVRIAYLSGDLRDHPVGESIVELLERHDRNHFEVIAVSLIAAKDSPVARRIRLACDRFIEAAQLSDAAIVERLRELDVAILVDLMGYTFGDRPFILSARPAPLCVSYLGYPGTRGMACVDYLMADRHVVPPQFVECYDERIAWLPHSFFPSDTTVRPQPGRSRADEGLPEDAVVLCGFCALAKLAPDVFGSWMRILAANPKAVLWLQSGNEAVQANLRQEASARAVDPARLHFAARIESRAAYLGRLCLADLFLDTWPYNAHSTARDALWAALPVLTRGGRSFASRVAGSLLMAVGLPELVTPDLESYEALALALVRDPARLQGLRARLMLAREQSPLFDSARLCRNIEQAYRQMVDRCRSNLEPAHFAVDAGAG